MANTQPRNSQGPNSGVPLPTQEVLSHLLVVEQRLAAVLEKHGRESAVSIRKAIVKAFRDHCTPDGPEDDTTLVVLRAGAESE